LAEVKPKAPIKEKKEEKKEISEEKLIRAPIAGIFYRSSAPNKPPYVEVGKKITTGDVVCIIEAMKVFNEIKSPKSGVIKEIPISNGSPVKKDDIIFILE
ncbi:MAG: biotin/lipoyl-binding protein, partial [bacterium]|nr:biotin/lipoyl-binding protein [bacterium]